MFAPFTVQALERPGSHVVFSSKDFPGTIPDHSWCRAALVEDRPKDVQKLVDAWYKTLDYIEANPEASTKIMAEKAGLSPAEYDEIAIGHPIFTAAEALDAFEDRRGPHVAASYGPPDQPVPRRLRPHQEEGLTQGSLRPRVHPGLRGFQPGP